MGAIVKEGLLELLQEKCKLQVVDKAEATYKLQGCWVLPYYIYLVHQEDSLALYYLPNSFVTKPKLHAEIEYSDPELPDKVIKATKQMQNRVGLWGIVEWLVMGLVAFFGLLFALLGIAAICSLLESRE